MKKTAKGIVRGLSTFYADGVEHQEIHIKKNYENLLPNEDGQRVECQLMIGNATYSAGIRSTRKCEYIWICPDLVNLRGEKVRLADLLKVNKFAKNETVRLEIDHRQIHLMPAE